MGCKGILIFPLFRGEKQFFCFYPGRGHIDGLSSFHRQGPGIRLARYVKRNIFRKRFPQDLRLAPLLHRRGLRKFSEFSFCSIEIQRLFFSRQKNFSFTSYTVKNLGILGILKILRILDILGILKSLRTPGFLRNLDILGLRRLPKKKFYVWKTIFRQPGERVPPEDLRKI